MTTILAARHTQRTHLAVLAKNALIGSDAGTAVKQFFLQGNRQTEDAVLLMKELTLRAGETGTAFFDASGGTRSLAEAIDILRRGTEGLSQQELATTFGKLFGSDAARTAAFLVRTTREEFDALVGSIQRSGAAADIAAAQNVGLRGIMKEKAPIWARRLALAPPTPCSVPPVRAIS